MFRTFAAAALLVTTTALVATGTTATAAEEPAKTDLEQVAPLVQPSIVYEAITWKGYVYDAHVKDYIGSGGKAKLFTAPRQCTGFVVNPDGWIATAGHCVDTSRGKDAVIAKAAEWASANNFYSGFTTPDGLVKSQPYAVHTLDGNGKVKKNTVDRNITTAWGASVSGVEVAKSKPARVIAFQKFELGDAALLKVDESDLNAIPLGDTKDVEINDNVVTVGYPAIIDNITDPDLTPTFNPGTVSSKKTVADGLLPVLQLSASMQGGMSGGPTVNYAGDVVGVNSSGIIGESINYAITADRIKELLNSSGVKNKLSATTDQYRAGVKAFFDGDNAAAVKNLTSVVEDQPANGFASDFLKKAKALPDPPPPEDNGISTTLLLIGGGALLLLALLGGLLFMLLRRRSGPGSAPQAPAYAPTPGGQAGAPVPGGQMAGAPTDPGYPHPVTKVPTPRTPDEAGAPSGPAPVEPAEVRAATPAGFAPTSNGAVGQTAPRPSTSQPGVSASPGITSVSGTAGAGEHHFCTSCGSQVTAGGRFCGECGHPV